MINKGYFGTLFLLHWAVRMTNITIVGAGVHGGRMADRYMAFEGVSLRAVISPHRPASESLRTVPFFVSAAAWKEEFGRPTAEDVFDLCVHQKVLLRVLTECARIGVKNFILPKFIALTQKELDCIDSLAARHGLSIVIASQWHYARILNEIQKFVKIHRKSISAVEIVCSRSMDAARRASYTAINTFLPHMVQMALTLGVLKSAMKPYIDVSTREKIALRYDGTPQVRLETYINASKNVEVIRIYLKGRKRPALVANLSGIRNSKGFYTSLAIRGEKRRIYEDILEAMLRQVLPYFGGDKKARVLTLSRYRETARALFKIIAAARRSVTVIGGGIFGVLSAIEAARRGYPVTILEKEPRIMTGASLVNQCRVHMGYHYPRDTRTAAQSLHAKSGFEEMFKEAIVKRLNNYYLIAKEGSLTTPKAYVAFCKKMKLPHRFEWPKRTLINKEKIALSVRVPEQSFDAARIRSILLKKISGMPNVTLLTSAAVTDIVRRDDVFTLQYEVNGEERTLESGAIVNATYGDLNRINRHMGIELHDYQYELCEMIVARTPWRNTGWSIIDGPFFGIMPFGFSKDYLLYDVELSVLERSIGTIPEFRHDIRHYDTIERRKKRFEAYKKKWRSYVPEIERCEHLYSLYVVRTVLPKKDRTDTRPTLIKNRAPGFWKIFSGKVTTSVTASAEIARRIDTYLKNKFL